METRTKTRLLAGAMLIAVVAIGALAWEQRQAGAGARSEVGGLKADLQQARTESRTARAELEQVRKELTELRIASEQLRAEAASAKAFLDAEKGMNGKLREEVARLRDRLEKADDTIVGLRRGEKR